MTKFEIFLKIFRPQLRCFENLDQNRDFPKNWQKWRFSIKVDQNRHFEQFWSKSRFFEIFQEIVIFRKFCTKSWISEIWTKSKTIKHFDKNRDDLRTFWQKSRFSKIVAKIKIFRKFRQLLRFRKFLAKPTFFKTLTRIETYSSNMTKIPHFWKFWPKSRIW